MTANKRPRKPYRPRPVTASTMALACHHTAKPPRQDRAEVLAKLAESVQALCTGVATELHWCIAAGSVAVAQAIERQGVVRGLQEHLTHIEADLQAIYDRCRLAHLWLRPTLSLQEVDALRLLHELHSFQLEHLSRAELLAAIDAAQRAEIIQGHQVTVATDLERLAA